MVESIGRVFLAVDLGDEARHALAASLAGLDIPGKVVPPANWHITLRFVGSMDPVGFDRLSAALDESDLGPAFELTFGDLGAFPKPRRATVLWCAVASSGDRLDDLADTVEDACQVAGLAAEDRPFRAHLTLARIRPDQDVRGMLNASSLPPITMRVTEVALFRSHLGGSHARYEVMERFPLG